MNQPLRPGDPRRMGDHELLGRLGEGGMGTVFLGRGADGRLVAVKVVRRDYAADDEFLRRFRSEVNRVREVPPFSTAEVLGADIDHDPPYLVVEYVDGPSLERVIRDHGPLSGAALHSVAVGIATALTAIHGARVIHRDLKPANVLMAMGGVKVIDFGIARPLEATSRHTRTDQMVGTVAYMAPERFEPGDTDRTGFPADIFAWGAVVAYAATSRTPFAASSAPAIALRIISQPPDLEGLDEPLRTIVARSLAKDPADRPTARELLDVLLASQRVPLTAAPGPTAVAPASTAAAPGPSAAAPAPSAAAPGPSAAAAGPMAYAAGPTAAAPAETAAAPGPTAAAAGPMVYAAGPAVIAPAPAAGSAPGSAVAAPRGRPRRVWSAVAVLGVLAAGSALYASHALADRSGSPTAGGREALASPAASSAPSPSVAATGLPGILAGGRRTLLHMANIDHDLALPQNARARAGGGTTPDSLFVLVPSGKGYRIRSNEPDLGGQERCLAVKPDPHGSSSLYPAVCDTSAKTLFQLGRTGQTDEKNRPTYVLSTEPYGIVQWNEADREVYVEEAGDFPHSVEFSFVDRGSV